ncbi:MAG: hypothetical protein IT285_14735 [Bdellovibrionales bacterium]|nr:hypothetical protein [Bdellovibrionales bacterium]
MRSTIALAVSLIISAFLSGCATVRQPGWESAGDETLKLSPEEQSKLMAEAREAWAQRSDESSLMNALENLERLALANPSNYEVLALLCRGNYLVADGHKKDLEEKRRYWERAVTWGERAMATNPEFRKRVVQGGEPMENALGALKKAQIDAIYWTATSLGKWAKDSGIALKLTYKNRITKMIQRVEQLDPNFFYGAVYRYWGVYYAEAPYFAGGSMDRAKENFAKTFKLANNYFGSHVLYAESYLSRKGDKAGFRQELELVLKGRPEVLPDVAQEQLLEQRKAKCMLETLENYF